MALEPMAYVQKIYAGFLGMNIGIRLGAPVEPALWSYERIRDTYGDIRSYVKDYKHFAADDDANGPVFFLRALDDHAGEPTAQAVAEAWLNYAREGVGLYWWGGYGISTEHTAYLNLKNGVPAPQSGSIRQNGKTLAEQIGGQIFIDTWGLVAPADPARAARYARAAASVSHDGEGLNGAAFIAACISKAFETADIDAIMDAGLAQIPRESVYAAVVEAVRAFHRANPDDWRACRAMLEAEWGYDRYGGVCHIIPNAGVCALAMCYGAGDFARTVEIATMCSWDTDCNAGNVGTILGVACGLEGLPAHYRDPINDEIVLSGISGYLNILDIPSYAWELARWGYRLRGEPVPEEVSGRVREGEVYFDFSLPGSTHGLRFACDVPTCARLRDGSVLLDRMVRGQKAKLFYKPFWRRADFSDERYMPVFSPRAYPGQQVEMRLRYEKLAGELLILTPYVRNSLSGAEISLSPTLLDASDADAALRFVLPEVDGGLIDEIGVRIESAAPGKFALSGTLRPTLLRIWGPACYTLRPDLLKKEFGSVIPFSHNHGAWDLEGGRLTLLCEKEAQAFTGNYFMRNCQLEAHITPRNGTQALVALRAQGARRGYYAGLYGAGRAAIMVMHEGEMRLLAQMPLDWVLDREYTLHLRAQGDRLTLTVDGKTLEATDGSLAYGMAGYAMFAMGRADFGDLTIREFTSDEEE